MMPGRLAHQVALMTGGAGRACALRFTGDLRHPSGGVFAG